MNNTSNRQRRPANVAYQPSVMIENLSPQQQTVADWIVNGEGSANVIARAGSGKTYLLQAAVNHMTGNVFIGAYNKPIADEMKGKVARLKTDAFVTVSTFHSAGLRALVRLLPGRANVFNGKLSMLIKIMSQELDDDGHPQSWIKENYGRYLRKIVSLAKQAAFGCKGGPEGTEEDWLALSAHHDLESNLKGQSDSDTAVLLAMELLERSTKIAYSEANTIDYDDMIYLPLLREAAFQTYDWVLIDEAQDLNLSRRLMAYAMMGPHARLIAVGDDRQCQPAGTQVLMSSGLTRPIEDIKKGDVLTAYCPKDARTYKNRQVEAVAKHFSTDPVVKVKAENGCESRYSLNHKCYVNFAPFGSRWVVYLMRRRKQYRVGCCQLNYKAAGNGLTHRLRWEGADAAWVLSYHTAKKEAQVQELVVSARDHIPAMVFRSRAQDPCIMDDTTLQGVWGQIGDNSLEGECCLYKHRLQPNLPLVISVADCKQSFKRPMVTYASNLVSGVLVRANGKWAPVEVTWEKHAGHLYSLEVSHDGLYTADGIVTHNSIYGFTGAEARSMEQIAEHLGSTVFPLTVTRRCGYLIVAEAQAIVPDIEPMPDAPAGAVRDATYEELQSLSRADGDGETAILCRNLAPLIALCYHYLCAGVSSRIEGREIAESLKEMIERMGKDTIVRLRPAIQDYKVEQLKILEKENKWAQAGHVDDVCSALTTLCDLLAEEGARFTQELLDFIDRMFSADNGRQILLCSIHKSKGREWDRVFFLGREELMPSVYAKQKWQLDQEDNLVYVAITRARRTLVYVPAPMKIKEKK